MKKEAIICFIVVIAVIIGNIVTQNYTKKCVATINDTLIKLEDKIKKEEKKQEQIQEEVEKTQITWDEMQEILTFYIEHDELEKVETQLFLLKGEIETELYDDAVSEIEKCIFILEHIEDKTALNLKNIF